MRRLVVVAAGCLALIACASCGGESTTPGEQGQCPLCVDQPACSGAEATLKTGSAASLIYKLKFGTYDQGFDFNGDGTVDNALAALGALADDPIKQAVDSGELVVPIEFYDLDPTTAGVANDHCVPFAVLVGKYPQDADGDGLRAGRPGDKYGQPGGDCSDRADDPLAKDIHPGATEVANKVDDDCNGIADETLVPTDEIPDAGCAAPSQLLDGGCLVPGADEDDADGDGTTVAQGDCDDRPTPVLTLGGETHPIGWFSRPGNHEVCGDGLDNDCNGAADDGCNPFCDPLGPPACPSAYVDGAPDGGIVGHGDGVDSVAIDPLSVDGLTPQITFLNGAITNGLLHAGPSVFRVALPIQEGLDVDFRITAAIIEATVAVDERGGVSLQNGMLGGVLDAHSMGRIKGLDISDIGVVPDDTLLDVVFVGFLGQTNLLGLRPRHCHPLCLPEGCLSPDIDVDADGYECFIDETPDDGFNRINLCVDGDGIEVRDGFETDAQGNPKKCTEALLPDGTPRFRDGLSITLTFTTLPTRLGAVDRPAR